MFITSLRHFLQEYVTPSLFLGEKEKKKEKEMLSMYIQNADLRLIAAWREAHCGYTYMVRPWADASSLTML